MKVVKNPPRIEWPQLLARPRFDSINLEGIIGNIIHEVKQNGDKSLIHFSKKFEGANLENLRVSDEEMEGAKIRVSPDLKTAISIAYSNINKFHEVQKFETKRIETMPGVSCWQKSVPIERVGIYIPGGTAPLFSTALMLAIPAKIAGCKDVVMCSPPEGNGKVNDAILYTADLCGINKIYKAGGAQAIAAMAFGTESIPKVDKIFGPGNQYVTAAKKMVAREGTSIDMPAGPSEVAIIADSDARPDFIAADLLSQAEHGADSQVVFITDEETLVSKVAKEIKTQLKDLPRSEVAQLALENSKVFIMNNLDDGMELCNAYAPEHLIIMTENTDYLAEKVINAGSVFLGGYSPEAGGDYASGTNHTLPTNGFARTSGGVSLDSFIKKITFQEITSEGLENIGDTVEIMAEAEMLQAHKNAVAIRRRK